MKREEVKEIIDVLGAMYPIWEKSERRKAVGVWELMLYNYKGEEVYNTIKEICKTSNSQNPPSISQIICFIDIARKNEVM